MDLPVWQALYEELKDHGFVVITVALDKSAHDARPWIEAARPAHPSLIDTRHALADLYNIVNVPTVLWIDSEGRTGQAILGLLATMMLAVVVLTALSALGKQKTRQGSVIITNASAA